MTRLRVSGDQLRTKIVMLDRFREAVEHPKPVFDRVVKELEVLADQNFSVGKRPLGGPWAKLSPNYAAYKKVVRPGRPILTFDGPLSASLGTARGPGAIRETSDKKLRYGTSIFYAAYHNRGTENMPARQVLPVNGKQLQALVAKAVHEHIQGAIKS